MQMEPPKLQNTVSVSAVAFALHNKLSLSLRFYGRF